MEVVSIIVPCRNEEGYIKKFIESIINIDYPKESLEVLIVDGDSDDGSKEIILEYANKYPYIKLLNNPQKTVPCGMNLGIQNAKGDIIIRMDVHAIYPKDYIKKLIYYIEKLKADNVGGAWETIPSGDTLVARSIALSMSSLFGVGNAKYRTLKDDKAKEWYEVDTVPFGCYRKEIFDKVGYYDEDLIRNQDNELNERIIKYGGKIYLIPSIKIKYFARKNYSQLFKMFYQYGYFGPLVDKKLKKFTRIRRYIPAIFLLSMFLPIIMSLINLKFAYITVLIFLFYTMVNLSFSTWIAIKQKDITLVPFLFIAFLTSHFSYGLGYIIGFFDFILLNKKLKDISLSR